MESVVDAIGIYILGAVAMTIIGTVFCAIFIGFFGFPVASLLTAKLSKLSSLFLSLAMAVVATLAAFWMFDMDGQILSADDLPMLLFILAYAIPAGLFYRQSIYRSREPTTD